jgi:hypothetical protein
MRKEKGKTYERAPWRGVSSWSSFHPTRVAREAGAGGGVVPVVCRPVVSSSVVPRSSVRRSTRGPPHEQLLVRLGWVVHRRLSSIVVVPGRLSFPRRLSFVVPSVVLSSLSLLSYGPGAPAIHPTSSCSSAWGWVLCRSSSSSSFVLFVVVVPVRRRPRRRPVRRRRSSSSFSSSSSSCRHSSSSSVLRHSSSTVVLRHLSSIPSFHPQSTPRAVAREAGGGWRCHRRGWWR